MGKTGSTAHKHEKTVRPPSLFLKCEDVKNLWKALNADKTDVQTIIDILAHRTLAQRMDIISAYKTSNDADLVEDLKNKLSGDLKDLIVAMMTPLDQYYAKELHTAVAGLGTDESDLIEILCTLSNSKIKAIRQSYKELYNVSLEDDIKGDTSGNFQELLVSLCNTERHEHVCTNQKSAETDAHTLNDATDANRWQTFSDILLLRSFGQLALIFTEYEKLTGQEIEKSIEDNFSGDAKKGLLAIVATVKNPAKFFAKKLYKSMAGLGTRDNDLIRVVVTRRDIDMAAIKQEYEAEYSKTLAAAIIDDTSGDYKTCLLTLIGEA